MGTHVTNATDPQKAAVHVELTVVNVDLGDRHTPVTNDLGASTPGWSVRSDQVFILNIRHEFIETHFREAMRSDQFLPSDEVRAIQFVRAG
jgi:hypothetical protein